MNPARLTDDDLCELIEALAGPWPASPELQAALDELYTRMRAEAEPGKAEYVERVIDRLRWTFGEGDAPPDFLGVREPRRPRPGHDADGIALPIRRRAA